VRDIARIGRLPVKRFRLFALASLLTVVTAGLLHLAAPIQAQTAQTAQAPHHLPTPTQLAQAQPAKPNAPTDAVLDWNQIAQTATVVAAAPAPQQFRVLAITHGAIFDAINAIDRRYTPYAVDIKAPAGASAEAAAAAAGHGVLTRLYPTQQAILDAALTASLAKLPDGQAKTDGVNVGEEVAAKLVAIRSTDGSDKKVEYKAEKTIGIWQPTPPLFAPALLPTWSTVTPFVIKSADQFKISPPLPLNSVAYGQELDEVKRLGGRYSTARTAEQTAAAIFSTISPVALWNTPARAAATAKGNRLIENARLFALLNFAGTDAYIAGASQLCSE
jgi:hypothetical protein